MRPDRHRMESTSIARDVNAERLALAGWPRAILLQVAHPLVAAGVADHSAFRDSPLASVQRLRHTVGAMLDIVFGDPVQQESAIEGIRAIHRRVNGTLRQAVGIFPAGTPYSAEDPDLLLWVHVTLVASIVGAYEALVRPLGPDERDAYCRQTAAVAVALGARPAEVPQDWPALEAVIARAIESGIVQVGPDGQAIADAMLRGSVSMAAGPIGWGMRRLTIGWLPPALRQQYGYRWDARASRRLAWLERQIRRGRRALPDRLALWAVARTADRAGGGHVVPPPVVR